MTHTQPLPILSDNQLPAREQESAGFGALTTARGCLPLVAMDVQARICGLTAQIRVEQTFVNTASEPIEATYIFPLPDRAGVTAFQLRVADRLIEGLLKERSAAREEYDRAIREGHRAAIAEENRPDVFSLRVGNLMPGDRAVVTLTLAGPLEYADGEATFRFPLVVAPRYIPGQPLPGGAVGPGTSPDTNLVPDASCISPPVMLPGFPNPVRLSLSAEIDPAGLSVGTISSSLHAVEVSEVSSGRRTVRIEPGERLNRDFILRLAIAEASIKSSLVLNPDAQGGEGTFQLTLVPPADSAQKQRPRDVVLVLDRSGSMSGWKMVAARRAAARIVDTLVPSDRLAVFGFDSVVETPDPAAGDVLLPATDRNRYRAVEFLARLEARGGTEMAAPLDRGTKLLAASDPSRDRILVLVTDGQVGGEDHILASVGKLAREIRIFTLGIDQAVNAGFLRRLAAIGGGACDLVESEDRLDAVMDKIHRRVSTPLLSGIALEAKGLKRDAGSLVPARMPDLHPGVPLVVMGRYTLTPALSQREREKESGEISIVAKNALDQPWSSVLPAKASDNRAVTTVWARGRVRDLEDRFAVGPSTELEQQIVATSLKFGVLCRFTAFVAVDRSEKVNEKGQARQILQPVDLPAEWEELEACSMSGSQMLSAPAGAAMLHSIFGAMGRTGLAAFAAPSAGSSPARGLQRKSSAAPPPAYAGMSVDSCLQEFDPQPDLSAYRARALGWLEEFQRLPAGDQASRVQFLRELARKVTELVADLSSIGAALTDVDPLRGFAGALAQLGPAADFSQVDALAAQTVQVLSSFAQVRPTFWKQSPTP